MPRERRSRLWGWLAVLALAGLIPLDAEAQALGRPCEDWLETRLYLGRSGPAGEVPDGAIQRFAVEVIAPQLPQGFTLLQGSGYWSDGAATRSEKSSVLIVLRRDTPTSDAAVGRIARAYLVRFAQRSVLRSDTPTCVRFYGNHP